MKSSLPFYTLRFGGPLFMIFVVIVFWGFDGRFADAKMPVVESSAAGDLGEPLGCNCMQSDGMATGAPCVGSCCNCSTWQAWASALFLSRDGSEDLPLAFGDPGTPKGSQVFGAGDLDLDVGWGPAVGANYRFNSCNRIGFEFYAVDSFSATSQVAGNNSVQFPSLPFLPEPTVPGDPTSGYGVATFNYTSRLYNTELNLYHQSSRVRWLTALVGFRWVELGDDLSTVFQTGNLSPDYSINVNNHLYGAQVGALAKLQDWGAWRFDGWIKVGLYGNHANQNTREDFTSAGGATTFASASDSSVALVGDIGISARRPITDRLFFTVSYMTLWIEGIALAPEQLDNSDPSSGIVSLDSSGGAFYHGGFVGGEVLW